MITSDIIENRVAEAMSDEQTNMFGVKNNISRIVERLDTSGDDDIEVVRVRNQPKVAMVKLSALRRLAAMAEAYELMQIAEQAENEPLVTVATFKSDLRQHMAQRRAARDAAKRSATAA